MLNLTFSNSVYSFYDGSCHPIKKADNFLTDASLEITMRIILTPVSGLANGVGLDWDDHTTQEIQSGSDISQQDSDNILSLALNSLK